MLNLPELLYRIRKFRESKSYTQEAVATELELSRRQYMDIENGKSLLSIKHAYELAKLFEIAITDLLGEKPEPIIKNSQYNKGGKENNYQYNDINSIKEMYEKHMDDMRKDISFLRKQLEEKNI